MKTRILLFCAIVLAFCAWLLLHRTNEQTTSKPQETEAILTNHSLASQPPQPLIPEKNQVSNAPPASNVSPTKKMPWPTAEEFSQQAIAPWYTPIEFYGKVIDENSNPIAGASIQFRWATQTEDVAATTATTESDTDGLFSLQGKRGRSLEVSVSKEGYYNSRKDKTGFLYALGSDIYSPSMLDPVIFHLQKKGTPEPLMRLAGAMMGPRQYRLDTKGTPTDISFYTGKRVSQIEGQFRVQYWMDVPQGPMQRQFDWRCQISVPGGGLQATAEEFPFTAPEQGYQESIQIESNTNAWTYMPERSFYVHLADGKYGRVKFSLNCSGNPFFGVEALINPSGSRNLEYDKYLPGNIMVDQSAP
jgi:hypothetical protein